MADPSFASWLQPSVEIASAGLFFAVGAAGVVLGARVLRQVNESEGSPTIPKERLEEARFVWRTGGVLVHDRYGVPSAYAAGGLTVEVCDECLVIRRSFRTPLELHFGEIESLERIRRSLGAHTTRLHRGVGRSRIDLNLEPEQHEALLRWHESRARVDRLRLHLAEARELDFGDERRVLALRPGGDDAWTVVRGVSEQLEPASHMIVERRSDGGALHHLRGMGRRLVPRRLRLTPTWTQRMAALPQVFVLGREVAWPELCQALDGARTYR
jgi:hypothetical protein